MNDAFLRTSKASIIDGKGQRMRLKGVNFGGWLMMEAYFMHAPNTPEQLMKKGFAKTLGDKALADLEFSFRRNFIQEQDLRRVALWGFNCVRLPFNCRLIENNPAGFKYLDETLDWANKYNVYVILDLHAAPGSQNPDWHSDSFGKAGLWTKKSNRHRVYALWELLADRYKDEPMIAGYDLLNEAVLEDAAILNEFYRETIKAVRRCDKNHILFVEGKHWAQDIAVLDDFPDDHWVYSIHFYEPMEFTFNLTPHLRYPLASQQGIWNKDVMHKRMEGYFKFAKAKQRPIHVGEFGVNYRGGLYGEHAYVKDLVKCFNDFGFHWNYWTYKAVKHYMFPDGLLSYYPNPPWVHRAGPVSGWDRWKDLWPKHQKDMAASWRTGAFTLNEPVLKALQ
ncbi:MAG: cellulase family glycosylhydrolase [Candidatus Omnitrophica bacterium]|nr:cellulase family glycosylhydrolase [Candidatus Omnitrophota bacterium]